MILRSSTTPTSALSPFQQPYWFLHQLYPHSIAGKLAVAIQIQSVLEVGQLERSLQSLVQHHPALRTLCFEQAGELVQQVQSTAAVPLEQMDSSSWTEEFLSAHLVQFIHQSFESRKGPFLRVGLFHRSPTNSVLLLVTHQLVCDRPSLLQLIDELFDRYVRRTDRPPTPSPDFSPALPLGAQNSDSVEEVPILKLPTRLQLPSQRTYEGALQSIVIPASLTAALQQQAFRDNISPETLLLAAFQLLLHRYSRETDIRIAWMGRPAGVSKESIGAWTNPVVVQSSMQNCSLSDYLGQVDRAMAQARTQQWLPFSTLLRSVPTTLESPHSPICQAAFTYNSLPAEPLSAQLLKTLATQQPIGWETLTLQVLQLPVQSLEFDLLLEATELSDIILITLQYNRSLYDAETIAQFTYHLHNLLAAIVAAPDPAIATLPVLSNEERQKILIDWNQTDRLYELSYCLHQWVEQQVERTPEAIALTFGTQTLTYRQLNAQANQLAHYLQAQRVGPESLVGVCMERSLELVVALLGILKAGAAYVPVDPGYPRERLAFVLVDAQVSILLVQQPLIAKLPDPEARVICLDTEWETIAHFPTTNLVSTVQPENLAYVIYTSGSTGKPKGVMNTHRGVCNRVLWMQEAYGLDELDTVLQKTPFSFDVSVWEFFWPLMVGARLIIAKPEGHKDPLYLMELIVTEAVTTLHFVPSMLQVFLETPLVEQCRSLKRVFCSGEALPFSLQERFFERLQAELHNLYGPTEAAIDVTFWSCQRSGSLTVVPIGRPIANTQIYLLDQYLQPVPPGVPGELHIGGVGVARGYLNRPDLTAERFIPNPFSDCAEDRLYQTGDLAYYLPDGAIVYLQRLDNQVKIRGLRIELGEIETVLHQHPLVQSAIVVARLVDTNPQLIAYVVPIQAALDGNELRQFLRQQLPEYMVPAAVVTLAALPLLPNGKVNRRALPEPTATHFGQVGAYVPPQDAIEQTLAQIWSELLNLERIGRHDHFFELGGHSLLAVILMAKIQQQLGKSLPLMALFANPTIADLAMLLHTPSLSSGSPGPLIAIQPNGTKPPFFCIHPAGGNVLCYGNLSRYIGNEQPFYGLQARGFYPGEVPLTRVEAMAQLYVEAIREFQPEGPYQVGGWSFGGVVAYEVAQQLRQQGQEVSRLAILDSYVPILLDRQKHIDDRYLVGVLSRVYGGMFGQDNLVQPQELQGLTVEEQIDYIVDKSRSVGIFPAEVQRRDNRRIVEVLVGTLKATYAYHRQPYAGKVTVFRANEKHVMAPDPQLVWVELFSILDAANIEIITVPGNHYTFILEPHVPVLAAKLAACLEDG